RQPLPVKAATRGPANDRERPAAKQDGRHAREQPQHTDAEQAAPPPADAAASAPPPPLPWALLTPLAAGALVAHGWRLRDLSPVQNGSCVVTLENARGRARR